MSGRELIDAQYRGTPGGWLDKLVTYSLWGAGIYFGGKFLLAWYEKRQNRYPNPPRYARR